MNTGPNSTDGDINGSSERNHSFGKYIEKTDCQGPGEERDL
jgi:hypothetical protein